MSPYQDIESELLNGEKWRPIAGFKDLYEVSNLGRVKNVREEPHKILKQAIKAKTGYLFVGLYKDGKRRVVNVQRLVAEAFLPKVEGKNVVDHIDEDKLNNRVSNLRWCTHAENMAFHRANQVKSMRNVTVLFTKPNKYGYEDLRGYSFDIGGENTIQKAQKDFETTEYGLSRLVYGQATKYGWKVQEVIPQNKDASTHQDLKKMVDDASITPITDDLKEFFK